MVPVNIYALTRITDEKKLKCLERQMSGRSRFLHIRDWETESLRLFCDRLCGVHREACGMKFYYSFTMPKLGKEFDLLRVGEGSVVNIELKSGEVSDEAVARQLMQNRYYLATLGKNMYSYTYISQTDRLVRLAHSGRLVQTSWEELAGVLKEQGRCYEGAAEELFKEEDYLISPLTDSGRFLRREYFLTSQQRDIKGHILKSVMMQKGVVRHAFSVTGFTGLPGTGKSILLYDIAMELSQKETVCLLHIGSYEKALEQLDERLKRVDFYYCEEHSGLSLQKTYAAILIDEGHRLSEGLYREILDLARRWSVPVIVTFDKEDAIPAEDGRMSGSRLITETEGYTGYKLTNRIRLNNELSSFIASLMRIKGRSKRGAYPSVMLLYAGDEQEADNLLLAAREDGYEYICGHGLQREQGALGGTPITEAVCKEYEGVVMLLDAAFYYDPDGYLRKREGKGEDGSGVRDLYHGLSRAKKKVALIVKQNPAVFGALLTLLQDD